jgi:hypothetical protein
MSHIEEVVNISSNQGLTGLEKRSRIFQYLSGQPDRGVSAGIECLLETENRSIAQYVAQYLEVTPDSAAEKTRAAERLRGQPELVGSASRLVPWLPEDTLDRFIADYLSDQNPKSKFYGVIYTIGVYWPERLRPFSDRIDDDRLQRALLSGAPDDLVDSLAARWRTDGDLDTLTSLALIRTSHALEYVVSLRDEIEDQVVWMTLVELAGGLPDSARKAGYRPAHLAFAVPQGETEHVFGGYSSAEVPICHICEEPAAHLLTLSADATPYDLSHDPSFYWYSCGCEAMDSTTVRTDENGTTVYYGPKGVADPEYSLTPGELSLVLENHPNQVGTSLGGLPGESLNQVGGLPEWVEPDIHPSCPECSRTMPFLASMSDRQTPFGHVQFDGIIYCFWCDDCRVSSTKIQH